MDLRGGNPKCKLIKEDLCLQIFNALFEPFKGLFYFLDRLSQKKFYMTYRNNALVLSSTN